MNHTVIADAIARRTQPGARFLVALAGPPGAGKSTLAASLAEACGIRGFRPKVVPMDGFHLDNTTLDARGLRARKGAPETFDAEGFVSLVSQLGSATDAVPFPTFDRARDCALPGADTVTPAHDLLLIEGNYLLLDATPWTQLHALFNFTVMLDPGLEVLERRLVARWLEHKYTPQAAQARAASNDLPNARRVIGSSVAPDLVLGTD